MRTRKLGEVMNSLRVTQLGLVQGKATTAHSSDPAQPKGEKHPGLLP